MKINQRIRFTTLDRLLETAGLISLLALILIPWSFYHDLPPEVPSHYSFTGVPDDWSGKAAIWTLPFVGLLLYLCMALLNYFIVTRISEKDAQIGEPLPREKILTMMQLLKVFLTLSFAYIVWMTVRVSQGLAEGLGVWFLPTFIVLMTFLPILFLVVGSVRKKA
jgi:uncharacterized membrane protein